MVIMQYRLNPNTFTTTGIRTPIIISMACFEKNPEFFIEYLISVNNDTPYNNNV